MNNIIFNFFFYYNQCQENQKKDRKIYAWYQMISIFESISYF